MQFAEKMMAGFKNAEAHRCNRSPAFRKICCG